jgi:hypothetical protein
MLQRRLREWRVQLSVVHVRQPGMRNEQQLLQSELCRRQLRIAQHIMQDHWQLVRIERRVLLRKMREWHLPSVVLLRAAGRCLSG